MGNCVTTMVHNNYSTTDKASTPKSSNQAATSLKYVWVNALLGTISLPLERPGLFLCLWRGQD